MSFIEKFAPTSGQSGSFVASTIKEKALVCDIRFPDNEPLAWFILHIEDVKYNAFKQAMSSTDTIDLTDYGKILYSGYGEPSDEIKAEMREKYGMYG